MSYYTINNNPIFLTVSKDRQLRHEVSKNKTPLWRIGSRIQGTEENEEKDKLIYDLLFQKYRENEKSFLEEWFYFDLKLEEAAINVWDLLYDYSFLYGYSYLKDYRDYSEKLISDHAGESLTYPMGKIFGFTYDIKPKKWWWKYRYDMKGSTIELLIDINKVVRINGNLKEFFIQFNDSIISFSSKVQVYFNKTSY